VGKKRKGRGTVFYDAGERRWVGIYTIGVTDGKPVRKKVYGPRGDRSDAARLGVEDKLFVLRKEQPYRGEIAPDTLLRDYLTKWLANHDLSEAARAAYDWAINRH
jgi:hypothetical protein